MPSSVDKVKLMAGFDQSRLNWEKLKKDASRRGVDVSVFKGGLGPAMDTFAKQYRAIWSGLAGDAEPPKPLVQKLKADQAKIDAIADRYMKICQERAKSAANAAHKAEWLNLGKKLQDLRNNRKAA